MFKSKEFLVKIAIALFVSTAASVSMAASMVDLHKEAVAVSNLDAGKVIKVEPLCPKNATCIVDGTVVTIQFTLNGCMDKLGNVAYHAVERNGNLDIIVSATNIHDERSKTVFCFKAATEDVTLQLINQYGNVHVDFIK